MARYINRYNKAQAIIDSRQEASETYDNIVSNVPAFGSFVSRTWFMNAYQNIISVMITGNNTWVQQAQIALKVYKAKGK